AGADGIETGWAQPTGVSAESELPEAGGIGGGGPFPTQGGAKFHAVLQAPGGPAPPPPPRPPHRTPPPHYPPPPCPPPAPPLRGPGRPFVVVPPPVALGRHSPAPGASRGNTVSFITPATASPIGPVSIPANSIPVWIMSFSHDAELKLPGQSRPSASPV